MMTSLLTALRIVGHGAVFLLAVVVFYLGLGVGLALNPLLGMLLWAAAAVTSGQEEPPSRRCPMLSPPPAVSTVVTVVQAVPPNYLCALAVNGTDEELLNWDFRVDRWETHSWHVVHPRGEAVPWMLRSLWPGRSTEAVVPPAAAPLRPGTYRVCLEYRNGNGKEKREACSVPLRLPPSSHWRKEEG